ncbi:MAG: quinone-dependent dihydroorotate dehydrogenase [SAR86 cluster bacterium]|nr:quinone-dependent dihydroorotate dehydrogenase [SAR86 cluster bacterium]MBL6810932.1 quinone-dependent dihydroorotate dehydrogenase [SAR86 cluster bacterium]
MYKFLRTLIFLIPPETAHHLSSIFLKIFSRFYRFKQTATEVKGLKVKNKLGLAAGMDKNGEIIDQMDHIGFGFIEIGTVTPKPQYGNPKPRLKRLVKEESLINSLGFNNKGADSLLKRLANRNKNITLGINIGPNKTTPFDQIHEDYIFCMQKLAKFADYITINISSPNTANLREFHKRENLERLLNLVIDERNATTNKPKLFVKFSPDEDLKIYADMIELINSIEIDGVIVSNTTNDSDLKNSVGVSNIPGGLSGKILSNKSNRLLNFVNENLNDKKILVAVGGVFDVDSYNEKLDLGADLVQMYTGLIYEGPNQVREIIRNGK